MFCVTLGLYFLSLFEQESRIIIINDLKLNSDLRICNTKQDLGLAR